MPARMAPVCALRPAVALLTLALAGCGLPSAPAQLSRAIDQYVHAPALRPVAMRQIQAMPAQDRLTRAGDLLTAAHTALKAGNREGAAAALRAALEQLSGFEGEAQDMQAVAALRQQIEADIRALGVPARPDARQAINGLERQVRDLDALTRPGESAAP